MAIFSKFNGLWVVVGTPDEVKVGSVSVRKADGSVKVVRITAVSEPYDYRGKPNVRGTIAADTGSSNRRPSGHGPCAECGRPGATTFCYDSSGIGGYCCPRCARYSQYERSFA